MDFQHQYLLISNHKINTLLSNHLISEKNLFLLPNLKANSRVKCTQMGLLCQANLNSIQSKTIRTSLSLNKIPQKILSIIKMMIYGSSLRSLDNTNKSITSPRESFRTLINKLQNTKRIITKSALYLRSARIRSVRINRNKQQSQRIKISHTKANNNKNTPNQPQIFKIYPKNTAVLTHLQEIKHLQTIKKKYSHQSNKETREKIAKVQLTRTNLKTKVKVIWNIKDK